MRSRRIELLSMALSVAIAAMLLSRFVSEPPATDAPERAAASKQAAEPAPRAPEQASLASVTLPPPPAVAESPRPVESASSAAASRVRTKPQPPAEPVRVQPLRPTAPAIIPKPARQIQPLQPRPQTDRQVAAPLKPTPAAAPPNPEPAAEASSTAPAPASPASSILKREIPDPTGPTVGTTGSKPIMAAGRPLLRLLEHGDGPRIDIAWPARAAARETLFRTFERCYGMRVALMTPSGDLFRDGPEARPWRINRDRYSGFVRQSGAVPTDREKDWRRRIRGRHPAVRNAVTVRVFPRRVDAMLMGGLHALVGERYRGVKSIDARYVMKGQAVFIDNILADGISVDGRIDLSAAAAHCRHRGPA